MPRKSTPPAHGAAARKSVPLSQVTSKPSTARRKPYGEEEEVKPDDDIEDIDDDDEADDDIEDIDDEDVEDFEDEDFDDDELDDFSDDDDE